MARPHKTDTPLIRVSPTTKRSLADAVRVLSTDDQAPYLSDLVNELVERHLPGLVGARLAARRQSEGVQG